MALGASALIPAAASALWVGQSAPLNVQPTDTVLFSSLTTVAGVPYVAWVEATPGLTRFYLFTARFSGGQWQGVGGLLDEHACCGVSITSIAGVPYLAWSRAGTISVARLVNDVWQRLPSPGAATNTYTAGITGDGVHPWIAYPEYTGPTPGGRYQEFAAELSGSQWRTVGPLNADPTKSVSGSGIASVGHMPYVTWSEPTAAGNSLARVARIQGGGVAVGLGSPQVNPARNGYAGAIADVGGVPYMTWAEDLQASQPSPREVRVARLAGAQWVQVGTSLNADPTAAANPGTIATVNGLPTVAWTEANKLHVKHYDSSGLWSSLGNDPVADTGGFPGLTEASGTPFVTYDQYQAQSNVTDLFARYLLAVRPFVGSPPSLSALRVQRVAHGVRFGFRLSQDAALRFDLSQIRTGRQVGASCVPLRRSNRGRPKCLARFTVGTLRFAGQSGANTRRFDGRLSPRRRLGHGTYQLSAVAVGTRGQESAPSVATFRL